jgi:hypothetical protein
MLNILVILDHCKKIMGAEKESEITRSNKYITINGHMLYNFAVKYELNKSIIFGIKY